MLRILGSLALFGMLLAFAPGPARAQQVTSREAIALRNQILEVQNQLNQLQQQVEANARRGNHGSALGGQYAPPTAGSPSGANDLVANLLQQVNGLQDQVRDLRGKVDDLSNNFGQKIADLNKKIGDLEFQLTQGKGGSLSSQPGQPMPPPAAPAAPSAPPPVAGTHASAGVLLQRGESALARADYVAAADNAEKILHVDAHSPASYDAQFLLARALFGQKQFTRAALAYNDTYGRSPSGPHAQQSLLGLAESLALIRQQPAACAAIAKLHQQFSTLQPDVARNAAALSRQAKCG